MTAVPPPASAPRVTAGLGLACVLACCLLVLSFARLAGDTASPAFNMQIVTGALSDPVWKTRLGLNLALFALALLALHLAYGACCWLLALLAEAAFPASRPRRRELVLAWFLAGTIWLLLANAARFPNSSLGAPYRALATAGPGPVSPYAAVSACLALAVLLVLVRAGIRQAGRLRPATLGWGAGAVLLLAMALVPVHSRPSAAVPDLPNVVLLGVDSLRPDAVTPDGTPHLHAFLAGAVRMTDAVTPLARTFPSWVSILTGRHPHTTGAYLNLLPRDRVHTGDTLPALLRAHGYHTRYAIDETRFSNVDESYGFERAITPAMGASDFVIAWFADTPLSNAIVNTRLGGLLFPHVHANRAAHVTYDPDAFVERIGRDLGTDRPLFLATHLTLPHWPYTWAASPPVDDSEQGTATSYAAAIHRADRQAGDLLALLQRRGFLDNAIVIVLSDHGESLGEDTHDFARYFPGQDAAATRFQRWGHGTSVFSPHQYRVVLGIRAYGRARTLLGPPRALAAPVSLIDLAPTVLELAGAPARTDFDGRSLVPLLRGVADDTDLGQRIRFTESEYNPQGFSAEHLSASALARAARVYRLESDTDRIVIRSENLDEIMSTRQYAALGRAGTVLAAVPDGPGPGRYRFVLVPGPQGLPASEAGAEAARLQAALLARFPIQPGPQAPAGP